MPEGAPRAPFINPLGQDMPEWRVFAQARGPVAAYKDIPMSENIATAPHETVRAGIN